MSTVFKKFSKSDISITPFNAHKQSTFNSASLAKNGGSFYSASFPTVAYRSGTGFEWANSGSTDDPNNHKKFFPDTVWAKFNNPNFYYSGNSASPEAYSLAKLSNTNGFFSEYAKYSIAEDMAETFSFMNSRKKYVSEVINSDKILNKKVIFIKEGMLNIK